MQFGGPAECGSERAGGEQRQNTGKLSRSSPPKTFNTHPFLPPSFVPSVPTTRQGDGLKATSISFPWIEKCFLLL